MRVSSGTEEVGLLGVDCVVEKLDRRLGGTDCLVLAGDAGRWEIAAGEAVVVFCEKEHSLGGLSKFSVRFL